MSERTNGAAERRPRSRTSTSWTTVGVAVALLVCAQLVPGCSAPCTPPPIGFVLSGGDCAEVSAPQPEAQDDDDTQPDDDDIDDDDSSPGGNDDDSPPADADGDGFAAPADCDDSNPGVHPGAEEICDGVDNDCDSITMPGETLDGDGDGALSCNDCDDSDPLRSPVFFEVCDGIDNDCVDGVPPEETDDDGDGASECADNDCDDGNALTHPGADEVCDGEDNDCDLSTPSSELDDDGDGWSECEGDCDDLRSQTHPAAPDLFDGLDNDCNGSVDHLVLDVSLRIEGAPGDGLGASVDCAQALDGDAATDLLLGAPGASLGNGRVGVLYGPLGISTSHAVDSLAAGFLSGTGCYQAVGEEVVVLGDFDDDGCDDVAVRQELCPSNFNRADWRMVRLGCSQLPSDQPLEPFRPTLGYALSNTTVGPTGDMDGDTLADLSLNQTGSSKVSIQFGDPTPASGYQYVDGSWWEVAGNMAPDGWLFTGGRDLDGDTFPDAAVGGVGRIHLVYGGSPVPTAQPPYLDAPPTGLYSLGLVDDFDGDGRAELAVLASNAPRSLYLVPGANWSGSTPAVHTVSGSIEVTSGAFAGGAGSDNEKAALGTTGDVDADGRDDLLVNVSFGAGPHAGAEGLAVFLHSGGMPGAGATFDDADLFVVYPSGASPRDLDVCDIDTDGVPELLLGDPQWEATPGGQQGRVIVAELLP